MEDVFRFILIIILSYLVGSFPTAVMVSKKFHGFDIREKGSGNMGSTNAFRLLGWKWGLTVQIIDVFKGIFAVTIIAYLLGRDLNLGKLTWLEDFTLVKMIAGFSAIAGHIWSFFVNFKGGKGINTAAGMLIGIVPIDVSIGVGIFLIVVVLSGFISLGSISAAIAIPLSLLIRYNIFHIQVPGYHILIVFLLIVMGLVIYTHRKNVVRLFNGTENRFSKLQLIKCKSSSQSKA